MLNFYIHTSHVGAFYIYIFKNPFNVFILQFRVYLIENPVSLPIKTSYQYFYTKNN